VKKPAEIRRRRVRKRVVRSRQKPGSEALESGTYEGSRSSERIAVVNSIG